MAWTYVWSVNDLKNWQLILNPTEDSLKKSQQFTQNQFAVSSNTAAIQSVIRCDNGEISLDGKAALTKVSSTVPGNTRITVPDLRLTAKGNLNQKINFTLQ